MLHRKHSWEDSNGLALEQLRAGVPGPQAVLIAAPPFSHPLPSPLSPTLLLVVHPRLQTREGRSLQVVLRPQATTLGWTSVPTSADDFADGFPNSRSTWRGDREAGGEELLPEAASALLWLSPRQCPGVLTTLTGLQVPLRCWGASEHTAARSLFGGAPAAPTGGVPCPLGNGCSPIRQLTRRGEALPAPLATPASLISHLPPDGPCS